MKVIDVEKVSPFFLVENTEIFLQYLWFSRGVSEVRDRCLESFLRRDSRQVLGRWRRQWPTIENRLCLGEAQVKIKGRKNPRLFIACKKLRGKSLPRCSWNKRKTLALVKQERRNKTRAKREKTKVARLGIPRSDTRMLCTWCTEDENSCCSRYIEWKTKRDSEDEAEKCCRLVAEPAEQFNQSIPPRLFDLLLTLLQLCSCCFRLLHKSPSC